MKLFDVLEISIADILDILLFAVSSSSTIYLAWQRT